MIDNKNDARARKVVETFLINQYIPKLNIEIWNGMRGLMNTKASQCMSENHDRFPLELVQAVASPSNKFSRCYSYFHCIGYPVDPVRLDLPTISKLEEVLGVNFGVNFDL
jgi:hypothetical protein